MILGYLAQKKGEITQNRVAGEAANRGSCREGGI